ncbi:MAG: Ribosomal protein [archaeon]|jgi:ribosomal protein L32E
MPRKKFIRAGYWRYSKLGLRRKKKLIYRKAKGQGNKVRLGRAGRLVKVKPGYGRNKTMKGLIRHPRLKNLTSVLVWNVEDVKKLQKNEVGVVAKIGGKKKFEIAQYARDNKIQLMNLHPEKFIKKIEDMKQEKKMTKQEREKKLEEKEKKAKEKDTEEKKEAEKAKEEPTKEKLEEKIETKEEKKAEKENAEEKKMKSESTSGEKK